MKPELHSYITQAISSMEGWCAAEKAIPMAELILTEKPKVVVELGVYGGRSVIPQAMALRENGFGKIYGIDPWKKEFALEGKNDPANDEWWSKLDLESIHRAAVKAVWDHSLDPYAIYIRAASQHCVELFPSIDILHIDGCHSEESSTRDVHNYLPRVKSGGYIWFDDSNWPTTQKALAMVAAECDQLQSIMTHSLCTLFRKK